jgi:hypothetical protein
MRCNWAQGFCGVGVNRAGAGDYAKRRFNCNADVVLSKLFAEYVGPSRTYNASEADLFIVPFPSQAHLHCKGRQLPTYYEYLQRQLVDRLEHFTPATRHKHIFLSSAVLPASNKWLRSGAFPLVVSIGPVQKQCSASSDSLLTPQRRPNCGQVVIPYANMNRRYQPGMVQPHNFRPLRDRQYALVAKLNANISGNGLDRQRFLQSAEQHSQRHNGLLAGKLMLVGELGPHRILGNELNLLEAYRHAIFCPCLRGDEPPQKRFFDVILSGCLPVVLEYDSVEAGRPSWFAAGTAAVHNVYPFAQGTFYGVADMGIDYNEFFVRINGTCGPECILPQLEDLLLHHMDHLQVMQDKMKRFASLFTFGMAEYALSTVDAVAAILVEARHFVRSWNRSLEQS